MPVIHKVTMEETRLTFFKKIYLNISYANRVFKSNFDIWYKKIKPLVAKMYDIQTKRDFNEKIGA